ncbi:hypothetical protein B0J18DRAFT_95243 [Chaetomium sp. MPI-SDFR-AT-0129]|nr:hypothetical protein B0J18DRAFT_95243 [Chaetomium sp. MPI-SDFR-AT-0129]
MDGGLFCVSISLVHFLLLLFPSHPLILRLIFLLFTFHFPVRLYFNFVLLQLLTSTSVSFQPLHTPKADCDPMLRRVCLYLNDTPYLHPLCPTLLNIRLPIFRFTRVLVSFSVAGCLLHCTDCYCTSTPSIYTPRLPAFFFLFSFSFVGYLWMEAMWDNHE